MHLCTKVYADKLYVRFCVKTLFLFLCSCSGVQSLACSRPCAEAAAKATDKCNGMTVLSWQFTETACLSA